MQAGYHSVIDGSVKSGRHQGRDGPVRGKWKTEPAQAFAENALTQNNNKIDAFLVSYDGESLGVMQAIEGAGLSLARSLLRDRIWSSPPCKQSSKGAWTAASGRLPTKWALPAPNRGRAGSVQARDQRYDQQWRRRYAMDKDPDLLCGPGFNHPVRLQARLLAVPQARSTKHKPGKKPTCK